MLLLLSLLCLLLLLLLLLSPAPPPPPHTHCAHTCNGDCHVVQPAARLQVLVLGHIVGQGGADRKLVWVGVEPLGLLGVDALDAILKVQVGVRLLAAVVKQGSLLAGGGVGGGVGSLLGLCVRVGVGAGAGSGGDCLWGGEGRGGEYQRPGPGWRQWWRERCP